MYKHPYLVAIALSNGAGGCCGFQELSGYRQGTWRETKTPEQRQKQIDEFPERQGYQERYRASGIFLRSGGYYNDEKNVISFRHLGNGASLLDAWRDCLRKWIKDEQSRAAGRDGMHAIRTFHIVYVDKEPKEDECYFPELRQALTEIKNASLSIIPYVNGNTGRYIEMFTFVLSKDTEL